MILIADAHAGDASAEAFFEMLDAIADTGEAVVFLGDIFDLWIGLPRYETDLHRRFIAWCRRERDRRAVGFVEGNHEFFVVRHHSDAFTWSSENAYQDPVGRVFVHGDLIDRRDLRYRFFRVISKNALVHAFLGVAPAGPSLVRWVQRCLGRRDGVCSKPIPRESVARFSASWFARDAHRIFCGHFHPDSQSEIHDESVVIVPAWNTGGCIAITTRETGVRAGPWQSLLR